MSFTIYQNEKTPFQGIKTRSLKSPKIDLFPKGLTHGFNPKMAIFPTFFYKQYRPGECFLRYSRTKKRLFGPKKQEVQKVQKLTFSKGVNPWFWSKNGHFTNFFFQAIQARKMSFTIFQNEKTPFQGIKTRSLKSPKTDIFPKGLTHGFGPKMAVFPTLFLQAIQTRRMFVKIFQNEKTPIWAKKTRSSKRPIIDIFPKGLTHAFGPKMAIFPTFFFRQYRLGKCLL